LQHLKEKLGAFENFKLTLDQTADLIKVWNKQRVRWFCWYRSSLALISLFIFRMKLKIQRRRSLRSPRNFTSFYAMKKRPEKQRWEKKRSRSVRW